MFILIFSVLPVFHITVTFCRAKFWCEALKRFQPCVAVVVVKLVTADIHLTYVCHIEARQRAGAACVPVVVWLAKLTLRGSSSLGAGPALEASGGSTEAFMLFNYRCSRHTSSTFYCPSSMQKEMTTKPWHCPQVEMFWNSSLTSH